MHHPLYWTQRYMMYKVTTKKKMIGHNSLQLNRDLLFMRSDPQSNQRYETDPINTWMRAFVCLKLFSLRYEKRGSNTKTPMFFNQEKLKRILASHCFFFFSFFLYFLQSDLRIVLQKITPFYPVLCSSDFSDMCHSHFFTSIKKNWRTGGNRTRASRLVSENSTTEPPVPCWANHCLNEDTR